MINLGILLPFVILSQRSCISADLASRLKSYETLHHSSIVGSHRIVRRDDHYNSLPAKPASRSAITELTITTLGRTFDLRLTPNVEIFAPGFSVESIQENGDRLPVILDPTNFLYGIVKGEDNSMVHLHWENKDLNAKIVTSEDTYYIEPSKNHLPESDNYTMISYRASDLLVNSSSAYFSDGVRHIDVSDGSAEEVHYSEPISDASKITLKINKRQTISKVDKNTCGLLLVVDAKFLKEIMNNDQARATNYIVDLVSRVDTMYRVTQFADKAGMGFQIRKIFVHAEYSTNPWDYNRDMGTVVPVDDSASKNPVNQLLDAFGRVDMAKDRYNEYCLAHLFTAYAFQNGVLGLAYIASPSKTTVGGICSNTYYDSSLGARVFLNTGWSSAKNKQDKQILAQEAEIVLAHELGHNWGAEHDPDNAECSPGSTGDGNFIMFTYSVSGFRPNNKKFSECSKRSMAAVLANKADMCFQEKLELREGNYRRDGKEECDDGILGSNCCSNSFKYTPNSVCSEMNDPCCTNCSISKAKSKKCATASDLTCQDNTFCDGISRTCPIKYKPIGSPCLSNYGRCMNSATDGIYCAPFPLAVGLRECHCTEAEYLCILCYEVNTVCKPFSFTDLPKYLTQCRFNRSRSCTLQDVPIELYDRSLLMMKDDYVVLTSTSCQGGFCNDKGVCERQSTDIVARLWQFLTHLDPAAAVQFMRDNIVGTIIVFSLVLWLPCVIAICCIDKKRAKQEQLEEQMYQSMRPRLHETTNIRRAQMH